MIAGLALAVAGLLCAGPALAADGGAAAKDSAARAHDDASYTFGVGAFVPEYTPPAPGTYELPPIDTIGDHDVVDAQGRKTTLFKVTGKRLAVVSFIYGTCSEAAGCPMSTAVLHRLDQKLAADPGLAREVALVTVSFDPVRDAPRLAEMQKMRAPGSTWQFVTARDEASLRPVLEDFGQTVSKVLAADGSWTGLYRHVLKVYLVDRERRVRNIYSVGYLHPDLVMNDLETLRLAGKR